VAAVEAARAAGGRVVAIGTTVVRALESAAASGALRAGRGLATLRVTGAHRPRVVDGVMTGVHGPGESHFALLTAFAPEALLRAAHAHAGAAGYLDHEFGDSQLIL
jgi:S-adenosylmethionine:tRNA ribosyltransferase-isomerase